MVDLLQTIPSGLPELSRWKHRAGLLLRGVARIFVAVPAVLKPFDPARREACRFDFLLFCLTYFPLEIFRLPSRFHYEFIAELQRLALSPIKEKKAVAAPRGIGKSMLMQLFCIWCMCYRHRKVFLWVCVNKTKATERMDFVKSQFLKNELLHQDFPELCQPVRDFGGDPRTSHPYTWISETANLANNCWMLACGIDGAILGTLIEGMRVDFVAIDDPEDSETVQSEVQTKMRRTRIEKEIGYLCELGGRISVVIITTIRAIDCLSHEYTDAERRPDWEGEVFRAVEKFPAREDLWERYMGLVGPQDAGTLTPETIRPSLGPLPGGEGKVGGTPAPREMSDEETIKAIGIRPEIWAAYGAKKHGHRRIEGLKFYASRKEEMDRDAVMLDPVRLPLHEFYYELATEGKSVVFSELQNDPLKSDNVITLQLDVQEIRNRQSSVEARVVPSWAPYLLGTVDVGLHRLHWAMDGVNFELDASQLIQCGVQETNVNESGRYEMSAGADVTRSLLRKEALEWALNEIDTIFKAGFVTEDRQRRLYPLYNGVDIGGTADKEAWNDIVIPFCRERYPRWIPMKGEAPWRDPVSERAEGRNFIFEDSKRNPNGRMDWNTNWYKDRMYQAYKVPLSFDADGRPPKGARLLHKEDAAAGFGLEGYAVSMTSERYIEEFKDGKAVEKNVQRRWMARLRRKNHWWDCCGMMHALKDLAGLKIGEMGAAETAAEVRGQKAEVRGRRIRERY